MLSVIKEEKISTKSGKKHNCFVRFDTLYIKLVNSAVEWAVRDIEVDTKTTEGFTKAEQEIILWGQQNGEFTPDYDTEELAEYLHNVLVGLRGMARTSTTKEKLHCIAKLSMNFLKDDSIFLILLE